VVVGKAGTRRDQTTHDHVRKFISKTGKHAEVRRWPYVYEYVQ
jgi:hypothetical protein